MQHITKDGHERNYYQTLFTQHCMDRCQSKVLSRTIGCACAGRTVVTMDLVYWNSVSLGQVPDKLSQRSHLCVRG